MLGCLLNRCPCSVVWNTDGTHICSVSKSSDTYIIPEFKGIDTYRSDRVTMIDWDVSTRK